MVAETLDSNHHDFSTSPANKPLGQRIMNVFAGLASGRTTRGKRIAGQYLARLDDAALRRLGLGEARIREIRAGADQGVLSF